MDHITTLPFFFFGTSDGFFQLLKAALSNRTYYNDNVDLSAVQNCNHYPHMATEHLKCVCYEQGMSFKLTYGVTYD